MCRRFDPAPAHWWSSDQENPSVLPGDFLCLAMEENMMSATVATTSGAAPPKRLFVPQDLDVAVWAQVAPLGEALLGRSIRSADELAKWLLDFSELHSVIDEYGSRRYIDKSCHTEDPEIEKRFLHFVENIEPKFKPVADRLQRRFL